MPRRKHRRSARTRKHPASRNIITSPTVIVNGHSPVTFNFAITAKQFHIPTDRSVRIISLHSEFILDSSSKAGETKNLTPAIALALLNPATGKAAQVTRHRLMPDNIPFRSSLRARYFPPTQFADNASIGGFEVENADEDVKITCLIWVRYTQSVPFNVNVITVNIPKRLVPLTRLTQCENKTCGNQTCENRTCGNQSCGNESPDTILVSRHKQDSESSLDSTYSKTSETFKTFFTTEDLSDNFSELNVSPKI